MIYSESLFTNNEFLFDAEATRKHLKANPGNNTIKSYTQRDQYGDRITEIKIDATSTNKQIETAIEELRQQKIDLTK